MSDAFFISGIQQVGVGTYDVMASWKWYNETFGMNIPVFHERAAASLMYSYTGGEIHYREALLALNRFGGGGLEIWQYVSRKPLNPYEGILPGDYGIYATRIKCASLLPVFDTFYSKNYNLLQEPHEGPDATLHFYFRDPSGNIFDVAQSKDWFVKPTGATGFTGGVSGVMIGVSDIEKSLRFYRDLLGFEVQYDVTGCFEDFEGLPKHKDRYRRVMLRRIATQGPFSGFLGVNYIELIVAIDREPKPIYQGRLWGDPGFIHLCFDIVGMDNLIGRAHELDFPVAIDSKSSFSMAEASGRFLYIDDPDGTPIEFVQTARMPIHKKLKLFLNLEKRKNPEQPLPHWLLRTLKFQQKSIDYTA